MYSFTLAIQTMYEYVNEHAQYSQSGQLDGIKQTKEQGESVIMKYQRKTKTVKKKSWCKKQR